MDDILVRAIWQSFANWHVRPNPTSVSLDQRKPSGKVECGRGLIHYLDIISYQPKQFIHKQTCVLLDP